MPGQNVPGNFPRMRQEEPGRSGRAGISARGRYGRWRLMVLLLAFMVILVNPFLNYFFAISWLQGWYQSLGIGHLWFVSPLEGLESLLVTRLLYLPSLIGMAIPLVLAFLLGRVFCSWICPISFFAEILERMVSRDGGRHRPDALHFGRHLIWFALVAELLLTMILGAPVFVILSPPGLVGREIMMAVFTLRFALEGLFLVVVLAPELAGRRVFCRSFCPLGGLLALVGARRRMVVRLEPERCIHCTRCSLACPMGLHPARGEALSVYCWNCGSCIDACAPGALAFAWHTPGHGIGTGDRHAYHFAQGRNEYEQGKRKNGSQAEQERDSLRRAGDDSHGAGRSRGRGIQRYPRQRPAG